MIEKIKEKEMDIISFIDELNLPAMAKYATTQVFIFSFNFLRHLIEKGETV